MADQILEFAKEFQVFSTPLTKKRVGRNEDGGYVVLNEISRQCEILYSYGVSDDWSFEEEFCDTYNCEGRLYDHTIETPLIENKRLIFTKEGLSSIKEEDKDTLKSHLIQNNHLLSRKTLKLDIEWHEWNFFENLEQSILENLDQIICEFHLIPVEYLGDHTKYFTSFHKNVYNEINQMLFTKYLGVLNKIRESHLLFHAHVNNSLSLFTYKKAKIPFLMECSFVKKSLLTDYRLIEETLPIVGLDFPNKPYKSEIENFYPFINEE